MDGGLRCWPGQLASAKTLLVEWLVECLARQMQESRDRWVKLVFPQLPADQIVAYLADELGDEVAPADTPTHQHVRRIETALREAGKRSEQVIFVMDEAHLLDQAALETMRLLLNLECQSPRAMTLLLVGQPALLPTLDRTLELNQRLSVKCLLRRFAIEESVAYVAYRLKTAGARRAIFTDDALGSVHHLTHGNPRQINRICDLALLVGFAEDLKEIGPEQIASVAEELVTVVPE